MDNQCENCRTLSGKVEELKTTITNMEKQRIHLIWCIWLLILCTVAGTVIGIAS